VKDRKTADEVIAKLHLQNLREHWSEIRQIRFVTSRISLGRSIEEIADELEISAVEVVERQRWEKILKILQGLIWGKNETWTDEESRIIWDDNIKLLPFVRVIDSKECSDHFTGPLITQEGKVSSSIDEAYSIIKQICIDSIMSQKMKTDRHVDSTTKVASYLKKAFPQKLVNEPRVPDMLGHEHPITTSLFTADQVDNLHTTNTTEQVILVSPDVNSVEQNPILFSPQSTNSPYGSEGVSPQYASDEVIQRPWKPKPVSLFDDLIYDKTDNLRLRQLVHELRVVWRIQDDGRTSHDMRYSASFLLRATFEEALCMYLLATDQIKKDADYSASRLLGKANALGKKCFEDKRLNQKISMIYDRKHIEDLNLNTHNDFGNHTPERLREIAGDMKPILKFICMDFKT